MEPIFEEKRPLIESKASVFTTIIANLFIAICILAYGRIEYFLLIVFLSAVCSFIILKIFKSRVSLFEDRLEYNTVFHEGSDKVYFRNIKKIEIEDYAPLNLDFFKQRVLAIYRNKWVVFRVRVTNPEEWKKRIEVRLRGAKNNQF